VDSAGWLVSPPAEVPPPAPVLGELGSVAGGVVVLSASPVELAPVDELVSPVFLELAAEVLVVDASLAAAFSALVLFGGVISGVERGTLSDTVAPPQALAMMGVVRARQTASAERALTAGPCAGRMSGSR